MTKYDEFYATAKKEMGVAEIPGSNDNPRILEYTKHTSLHANDDETPWCSAFACFVVDTCGLKSPNSAWARSWMGWGEKLEKPVKGCICVFSRGKDSGHVSFFDHEDETHIYCLGGNQGNRVSICAYDKGRLLGFRGIAS